MGWEECYLLLYISLFLTHKPLQIMLKSKFGYGYYIYFAIDNNNIGGRCGKLEICFSSSIYEHFFLPWIIRVYWSMVWRALVLSKVKKRGNRLFRHSTLVLVPVPVPIPKTLSSSLSNLNLTPLTPKPNQIKSQSSKQATTTITTTSYHYWTHSHSCDLWSGRVFYHEQQQPTTRTVETISSNETVGNR